MNSADTPDDARAIETVARRHGFSVDATRAMLDAVVLGNGSMAQFNHPEFGGAGQWMRGGLTMVGDMFNHRLKAAVDALCTDLASLAADRSRPMAAGGSSGYRSTGSEGAAAGVGSADQTQPATGFAVSSGQWWPGDLGSPNSSGAQNGARYAYFAAARRLAIDSGGQVTVYDTGEHQIGGVSQQQSTGSDLRFTSQLGPVDVGRLPVVHAPAGANQTQDRASPAGSRAAPGPQIQGAGDVPQLIEQLAELHARGILTADEFSAKKAELLRRI